MAHDRHGAVATAEFTREDVERVLGGIRPYVEGHGGRIEVVAIEGVDVRVRLHGTCTSCPSASMTLRFGVESRLREELPGFGELIADNAAAPVAPRRWWQFLG